jgi:hypothetical protein
MKSLTQTRKDNISDFIAAKRRKRKKNGPVAVRATATEICIEIADREDGRLCFAVPVFVLFVPFCGYSRFLVFSLRCCVFA